MKSANITYIPAIDHLRALAALLIFFYHGYTFIGYELTYHEPYNLSHWVRTSNPFAALLVEGHTAVALFMVLSGFLFTLGAYGQQISYCEFLRNRLLRTYPLFLLVVLVGMSAFREQFDFSGLLQTVFFMANMPGAMNAGPFSAMAWAVAVEWQFYLVFPFILLFVNRYGVRYLFGLILLFIALRGVALLFGANIRDLSYWTIAGRMDQFLVGMLAAVIYRVSGPSLGKRGGLFLVSTVLLFAEMYLFNRSGGWPTEAGFKVIWPTVEGAIWAAFLLGYIAVARWVPGRISSLLIGFGTISYSIYLLHFIVIHICIHNHLLLVLSALSPAQNAMINSCFILVPVCALATLSYFVIEKPFLQLRHRYVSR